MDYYSYYAANDYLAHHGVLGMKWGQHIFGDAKKSYASYKKKKAAKETAKRDAAFKKDADWVKSNRSEAETRVAKYGGRNVAQQAAKREYGNKIKKANRGTALGIGGGLASVAMGTGIAAGGNAAAASILISGGSLAIPVATAVGAYKTYKLGKRLTDQLMFTKDVGTINKNAYSQTNAFSKKK